MAAQDRPLRLAALLIVGALLAAFANSFDGRFFLDDTKVITDNPRLRHVAPRNAAEWAGPRALVDLTLAANYAAGGLAPAGYHAVNLAVHAVTALLLLGLVRRTLARPGMPDNLRANATPLAAAATLVWAVHPLTGAAVLYVCQRYELMAAGLTVLTLYALLRSAESPIRGKAWAAAALAACLAGMACKETMAVTPPLALLFDRTFLSSSWRDLWRRRGWLHAALLATSAYLGLPLVWHDLAHGIHDYQQEALSFVYFAAQLRVVSHYLLLTVWPQTLCLDYGWTATADAFGGPWAAWPVVVLAAATGVAYAIRRPRLAFTGMAFIVLLVPTSTVVPHTDLAFDHRMYLPLAALAIPASLALWQAAARLRPAAPGRAFGGLALAAAAVLGTATFARNRDFADEERMWSAVLAARPDNTRAAVCLTGELCARHRPAEAAAVAREALARAITPGQPLPDDPRRRVDAAQLLNNLGLALQRQSQSAEAMDAFARAVALAPGYPRGHLNYGAAALAGGDTNTALREVDAAYRLAPGDPDVQQGAADLLALTGRPRDAVTLYRQALATDPDRPATRQRLARLLATCPDAANTTKEIPHDHAP